MLQTHHLSTTLVSATGRHAAEGPEDPAAPGSWWRRLRPGHHDPGAGGGDLVVRVSGPLDDDAAPQLAACLAQVRRSAPYQVVLVRLDGCDFVNVRGFRALLGFQAGVEAHQGRLLLLDPPRSLRSMCAMVPGRLTVVPEDDVPASRSRPA